MTIDIIRSRRKTMALQVRENGSVVVRVPYHTREQEIRSFVGKHLDWIQAQREKFRQSAEQRKSATPLTGEELKLLREEARKDLTARTAYFAQKVGVQYGRISIRQQKTKWGSCSSRGNLNFNCLLMLAPENVRNYVVVHELCHRKQMNHSAAFWAEVERAYPDYQSARQWLKTHGQEIMCKRAE